MYPVSEAFLQAVQENTRSYYWTGKITTKAGAKYEFGAKDIVKGSGYIIRQCCGSTEMELVSGREFWEMFLLGIAFGAVPTMLRICGESGIYAIRSMLGRI